MRLRPVLILVPISLAALAAALSQRVAIADYFRSAAQPELPPAVSYEEVVDGEAQATPVTPPELELEPIPPKPALPAIVDLSSLPASFNLAVPFTPQAPFANWDETHEETCEEASVYMVYLYFSGHAPGLVEPQEAEDAILALVERQKRMFGFFEDTTVKQTAAFAREAYGYGHIELLTDPTIEDIKLQIAFGRPVIVPAAGRELHNPYFKQPGPDYHMLVIRGWTQDGFITNDPGTRRGEGYVYPYETIMDAMHDWKPEDVLSGRKVVIVIYPNE